MPNEYFLKPGKRLRQGTSSARTQGDGAKPAETAPFLASWTHGVRGQEDQRKRSQQAAGRDRQWRASGVLSRASPAKSSRLLTKLRLPGFICRWDCTSTRPGSEKNRRRNAHQCVDPIDLLVNHVDFVTRCVLRSVSLCRQSVRVKSIFGSPRNRRMAGDALFRAGKAKFCRGRQRHGIAFLANTGL
ncbi:hypothetical protein GGI60_002592 [Rhizobium lentis]|nr:hypothetical protein [Rhizobium lentis]MBB5550403.1 hypothetical protein [Rhizobium lentis]